MPVFESMASDVNGGVNASDTDMRVGLTVNARKYGIRKASAICTPPIALGDSMSKSEPWHAFQEELSRSSSQPRNYEKASSACV